MRTLLVWLIVLALPVQGASAATMAFCGPAHHGGGQARTAVNDLEAGMAAEAAFSDDASSMLKASQAAKQKCSVCASCCSLGAILTTVPVVPATEAAPTVFTTVVPTVDAFAADGPDRPPRNVLV